MKICVVGTGYVGLVVGICLAEWGNEVTCVDQNPEKVKMLQQGKIPIYEPGLSSLLQKNVIDQRISFTDQIDEAIEKASCIFICVGTPAQSDGSANLTDVFEVAKSIGRNMNSDKVVIIKSTVPVGTAEQLRQIIEQEVNQRKHSSCALYMASNPEFLREGAAVEDFIRPDRVIIGSDHSFTRNMMEQIYAPIMKQGCPFIHMDIASAELTKYAANAMLASRISYMNEIASVCEVYGADIEQIRKGIALDKRIGKYFLCAGIGYGGSCFPKDVKALIYKAALRGIHMPLLHAVDQVNESQKTLLACKVLNYYHSDLRNIRLAVWGLAFKPCTDDVRESPALDTVRMLAEHGAMLHVHDPKAMENAKKMLGEFAHKISYVSQPLDALAQADALLLLTEWDVYEKISLESIQSSLYRPVLFDGRQLWNPVQVRRLGMIYHGIGRNAI